MNEEFGARELIAVLVRLVSIGLVVYSLNAGAQLYAFYSTPPTVELPYAALSLYFLPVILAIILWKFPLLVASKLWQGPSGRVDHRALSARSLYTLGFVLMGVWLLYWALSDTAYWLSYYRVSQLAALYTESVQAAADRKASLVVTGFEFILAIFLIFGSKALASLIIKLRYAE